MKQLNLAEDIPRRVVKWRGSNQNNTLAAAYLCQLFIGYVHFRAEAVCFVDKYVLIFISPLFGEVVELTQGFKISSYFEIGENIGPRTRVILI